MSILETKGITKKFAKFTALHGISLQVEKGEIRSIIGPNGAGKTTFFNVVTGKFRPTDGAVYVDGRDITGKRPHEIIPHGIARSFQIINIFQGLTALENIALPVLNKHGKNMSLFSRPHLRHDIREECFSVLKEIGMENEAYTVAGKLSHGDKKKLDIAIGLARDPRVLLLDEPTAGLNPHENKAIINLIREIARKKTSPSCS